MDDSQNFRDIKDPFLGMLVDGMVYDGEEWLAYSLEARENRQNERVTELEKKIEILIERQANSQGVTKELYCERFFNDLYNKQ